MSALFHVLCFPKTMMKYPGGGHEADELCRCQPAVEIDGENDSILVHHRCDSLHPDEHNWVAVQIGLIGDENTNEGPLA